MRSWSMGLCWVHAERTFAQLIALNETERRALTWVRGQIWALYDELKAYRGEPSGALKAVIEAGFEALCATETVCEPLNQALHRFHEDKADLLRVLERPELPLHNNLSEVRFVDPKPRSMGAWGMGPEPKRGDNCWLENLIPV